MRINLRKKKNLTDEQLEIISTKDFFDRTVPGVIRFYTDHYICGNFYKSCWAVTEYPPSTEETAILAHLADRPPCDKYGTTKNRSAGNAEKSYDDHHKRCKREHQGSG